MILISEEEFNSYSDKFSKEINNAYAHIRNNIGQNNFYALFSSDGKMHKTITRQSPHSYPCSIETDIGVERVYKFGQDADEGFTLSLINFITYKSPAKMLVYPKARDRIGYGKKLLRTKEELAKYIAECGPVPGNTKSILLAMECEIYTYPIIIGVQNLSRGVQYNGETHHYEKTKFEYIFHVFDAKQARALVYNLKERNRAYENAKRKKRPLAKGEVGFQLLDLEH
jgi:hypothetical protein